ncbi:MAG: hypothetical protein ACR2JF_07070 [Iamia sp.]
MPRSRASSRTRTAEAGPRTCAEPDCETRLSVYNDAEHCSVHNPAELLRTRGRHIA